jgi:glucose/arabinose dehydrogenase/PKD repeat protein
MWKSNVALSIIALFLTIGIYSQENIAEGFYDELVVKDFHLPLGIRFDETGNCFVWEKGGRVYVLDSNAIRQELPVLDLNEEVMEFRDLGMLGFALHPQFASNGYIYVLYTVDKYYLQHFGESDYNPDSTIVTEPTISRLCRYRVQQTENGMIADPGSRKILIGESLESGIPMMSNFHGVGAMAFGDDGSLLISVGDGGYDVDENAPNPNFAEVALQEGILREKEFINFARAQLLDNYNGKILRINPETGEAYPSNPFFQESAPNSVRSKVFALGLRNPYRFFHIPGTGSHDPETGDPGILMIGDVGPGGWEELNIANELGANFGWPYFEGNRKHWPQFWTLEYENFDAVNPLFGLAGCEEQYFKFQDLLNEPNAEGIYTFPNPCDQNLSIPDTIPSFIVKRPIIAWSNKMWNPPVRAMVKTFNENGEADEIPIEEAGIEGEAFAGFSSIPGFWYETGDLPVDYEKCAFVADYSGWIRSFHFDDKMELKKVNIFREKINGIVDLEFNPKDQSIYYVNINTHELRRIFFGGNPAPVAVIALDKQYGPSDLTVQFDASSSYDPNNLPITYNWDFGDGDSSSDIAPQHSYSTENSSPQSFICVLTVTDSLGASATDEIIISLNNTPPKVKITSPKNGSLYPISAFSWVDLTAEVSDDEHDVNELKYNWHIYFQHNSHYHEEPEDTLRQSHLIIDPVGCNDENYWYRIGLSVTDKAGLSNYDEIEIYPDCGEPFGEVDWVVAESRKDRIYLKWADPDHAEKTAYTIEKFGRQQLIEVIGQIDLNDPDLNNFDFYDEDPYLGNNIYRIKSQHSDGRYDYSKVAQVTYPESGSFQLSPNPSSGICYFKLSDKITGPIELIFFTADGRQIQQYNWYVYPGQKLEKILDLNRLANGIYFVNLKSEAGTEQMSFMIGK